jgi:hypothetical protein
MVFNLRRTGVRFVVLLIVVLQSCRDNDKVAPVPVSLSPCESAVIAGYTDKTSYFPGDEIEVFLHASSRIDCGLRFYSAKGSPVFSSNVSLLEQTVQGDEPWKNGFKYLLTAKIKLPQTLASGIYSIENRISFIVKSSQPADLTVVYPINTINAYCSSGGKSLYGFNSTDNVASVQVSFLQPIESPVEQGECIECLKWFPFLSNLKINYITDVDLVNYSSFQQSKVLVIIGHSEYWPRLARTHFDQFVNEGKHAIILSGNTMWWHARYTAAKDALICHRDAVKDPEPDPLMKTILWSDPMLQYPIINSIGADFAHGGYGLQVDNGWDGYKIVNPLSPLLEGTSLKRGDVVALPTGEYDGSLVKEFDRDGFPILNNDLLKFEKLELIGFDRGTRGGKETIPTFIVFQRTKTSGVIVNAGSNSWCSMVGIGSVDQGDKIKIITRNAIYKLVAGENVFSN